MPGARTVLRHIADVGGTATYDDVQAHFAGHPDTPIPKNRIGGTLTSGRAVRRRIGPDNNTRLWPVDRCPSVSTRRVDGRAETGR